MLSFALNSTFSIAAGYDLDAGKERTVVAVGLGLEEDHHIEKYHPGGR